MRFRFDSGVIVVASLLFVAGIAAVLATAHVLFDRTNDYGMLQGLAGNIASGGAVLASALIALRAGWLAFQGAREQGRKTLAAARLTVDFQRTLNNEERRRTSISLALGIRHHVESVALSAMSTIGVLQEYAKKSGIEGLGINPPKEQVPKLLYTTLERAHLLDDRSIVQLHEFISATEAFIDCWKDLSEIAEKARDPEIGKHPPIVAEYKQLKAATFARFEKRGALLFRRVESLHKSATDIIGDGRQLPTYLQEEIKKLNLTL